MPAFQAQVLQQLAHTIFTHAGAPQDSSAYVAEHLVAANLAGHDSHGMLRIPQYIDMIDSGLLKPAGRPKVEKRFAGGAVIDGDGAFGQVAAREGMKLAIELARTSGTAAVTVHHCTHTGRIGAYTGMAARAGLIGIGMVNAGGGGQLVAPFGGMARRLSTNPISIAAPTEGDQPLVMDMASSIAPEGKIRARLHAREATPEGWLINARGEPTTNPADFYADPPGALLPLGGAWGHKGYVLAFMIDILAGVLTGAGHCRPNMTYPGDGMLVIALDVEKFLPLASFRRHVAELAAYVQACPKAPGIEHIYVPGEMELRKRDQRLREGIMLDPGTWQLIEGVCTRYGIASTLPEVHPA